MTVQTDNTPEEVSGMTTTDQANVIEYPANVQMDASKRCDRCGAQAYVAIEIIAYDDALHTSELLFCTHHYAEHEARLLERAKVVHDHRPYLLAQEQGDRDAASAAK